MGMLATTGVIVSEDTFGPVSDNAAGIAEMSGEFHGEPERIMVSLDAVGNTTKAVTKGFAIGSAVIAAVALFASFIETAGDETSGRRRSRDAQGRRAAACFDASPINVADPKVFIGLLIGGAVPFLFSALAIRAVGRTAGVVVQEVRNQFADGKIMTGEQAARLRPGHRHLHGGLAARARHAGPARRAHAGDHRLRHRLSRRSARSSPPSSSSAS